MNHREKLMMNIFIILLFISVMIIYLVTGIERYRSVSERVEKYRSELSNIKYSPDDPSALAEEIMELEVFINKFKVSGYKEGEIDIYRFGALVRNAISEYSLDINKINPVDGIENTIEFECTGKTEDLFSFLKYISQYRNEWYFLSLTIQEDTRLGYVKAVFRTSYRLYYE